MPRLAIEWSGLKVKGSDGSTIYSRVNESRPVALDTGYTLSTLPDDVFDAVSESFEVKKSGSNYYVPCQQPQSDVELLFGDSATTVVISVPFSELAIPANLQQDGDRGQDLCMFGFQPVSAWSGPAEMVSFGDTILRSAYLVVNFDTNLVVLSQAIEGDSDCQECIVEI